MADTRSFGGFFVSIPDWPALIADPQVQALVELALKEDIGDGDATTRSVFQHPTSVRATLVARSPTVVCGLPLASHVFMRIDSDCVVTSHVSEGQAVDAGTALMTIAGDARSILVAERVTLNFLMRLCGIASAAWAAVDALPDRSNAKILDTRKTMPGWRLLDKAAVATGGGENHRVGLFDGVIIKDNHIAAAGSITEAVRAAKAAVGDRMFVEVEVDTLEQYDEALLAEPDMILLDNFSLEMMREAVARRSGNVLLEASGGMTLNRIADVAATGIDRISMGALTHSALPADLALDFPGSPK